MLLATIGMWNSQERERLKAFRTENEQDVNGAVRMTRVSEFETLRFTSTQLLDNRTMLPILLQPNFAEQVHMAKAARLLDRLPCILPLAARTDGIYFAARTDAAVDELKALAFEHKYAISERYVYQFKDAKAENLPGNAQSYQYKEVYLPRVSEWLN